MSIREGGTTRINSLATKIKGLISTHEAKTGSSLQKGHVQAGGAPQTIGKTLSAGTDNGYYARADHVHTVDFSNILNTPDALDVVDNATTDDGTKPLSAKQGKILNDKKVAYMGIDDELNLYIGYDPITDIILTANKSIFQKNESVTFTATAKNGNTLLESVPVLFYNGNNYLGTSVTNSNGIATYNYIGVGAGKINTIAKNCSVVSNTYPVLDCIFMDYKSDGTKNTDYYKSTNATVTSSDGEITVYGTATGMYISNQVITGDFEAILECKNVNGNGVRVGFFDTNTASFAKSRKIILTNSDYNYLKFKRISGAWTVQRSTDGETWTTISNYDTSTLTSENCYFGVHVQIPSGSDERRLTYKNLKIYPI